MKIQHSFKTFWTRNRLLLGIALVSSILFFQSCSDGLSRTVLNPDLNANPTNNQTTQVATPAETPTTPTTPTNPVTTPTDPTPTDPTPTDPTAPTNPTSPTVPVTPVTWTVTVDQNGGTGLTQLSYTVNEGESVTLSNTPTYQYKVMVGAKDVNSNSFTFGQTLVHSNLALKLQWDWDTSQVNTSACSAKTATIFVYAANDDTLGLACKLQTGTLVNSTNSADLNRTALITAANSNKLNASKYLVINGANVEAKDTNGETALSVAARLGFLSVVTYLTESANANINTTTNNNVTPILFASALRHEDVVRYLGARPGINPNVKATAGTYANYTPYGYMVYALQFLLGADYTTALSIKNYLYSIGGRA